MSEVLTRDNLFGGNVMPVVAMGITVKEGLSLKRGTVLGRILRELGDVLAAGVVTGNGEMNSLSLGPEAKVGTYKVKCAEAAGGGGIFSIFAPDGMRLDDAVAGTPYVSGHICFTIDPGTTDFAVGDIFEVPVLNASGKCVEVDSAGTDGRAEVFGILCDDVDATLGDKTAVAYMTGEFNENALTFGGNDGVETYRDAARALGIFFKPTVVA